MYVFIYLIIHIIRNPLVLPAGCGGEAEGRSQEFGEGDTRVTTPRTPGGAGGGTGGAGDHVCVYSTGYLGLFFISWTES